MIQTEPLWARDRPAVACFWPDRVRLEGRFVLGPWYCLNRDDGSVVWERLLPIVNFITGLHDGTILAATILPGGKSGVGACALRFADGEVLWFDELSPVALEGNTFLSMDGSVRDLKTARVVGQKPALKDEHAALSAKSSLELALRLRSLRGEGPLELAAGTFVTGKIGGSDYTASTHDGRALWHYSPAEEGWHCGLGASRCVAPPYIYLLTARTPPFLRIGGNQIEFVPTQRYWLAFDIRLGKIVQEFDLGVWKECWINDVDEDGAILSFEKARLAYYRRQTSPPRR